MKTAGLWTTLALIATSARADFAPHVAFSSPSNIVVSFAIPDGHKIYAASITASASMKDQEAVGLDVWDGPEPVARMLDGVVESVFEGDVAFTYFLPEAFTNAHVVTIGWQACTETACFLPETRDFYAFDSPEDEPKRAGTLTATPLRVLNSFADADAFLAFLSPETPLASMNPLERARARGGLVLLIVTILIGGVLLNFTPCVLPLIPVNLAILGIGTQAASRRQGLLVGACFGLGITLAFGTLGILSVLTGATFGALQSSPVFNASIAIIFCVLALAMLDVITIDFSKLGDRIRRRRRTTPGKTSRPAVRLVGALLAGAGSALLAGACVAPVLIWTLVISATLVNAGQPAGAALPLFLGLGMGLPWLFFGGGMTALPRPGKWMNLIKYGFAIVFLAFALIYARTAWRILRPAKATVADASGIHWLASEAELEAAFEAESKPIVLYLTAEWCVACRRMSATTFRDDEVAAALQDYHAVMIDCTNLSDPVVDGIFKRLGVRGLPYIAIFDAPR